MKTNSSRVALYAGSFNPFHQGHYAIVTKAAQLFDTLYVVVTFNPDKENLDAIDVNYAQIQAQLASFANVKVITNKNTLTADLAQQLGAKYLVRSARDQHDYEYELELAAGNKYLNPELETILIIPEYKDIDFSSTLLRHQERLKKNV